MTSPGREAPPLPPFTRIVRDPVAHAAFVAARGTDQIREPSDVVPWFDFLREEEVEVVAVLTLDTHARVISLTKVARGSINDAHCTPREIFRVAVADNAAAIIVAHNHPSGVARPSPEDRAMTRTLQAAGRLLEIELFDHLIVTSDAHFSFARDEGPLELLEEPPESRMVELPSPDAR